MLFAARTAERFRSAAANVMNLYSREQCRSFVPVHNFVDRKQKDSQL
jgi:hypothetical protein